MVNSQEWLNSNYSSEERSKITQLDIRHKDLEGSLNLNDFINLKELDCRWNKLTFIDLSNCLEMEKIECSQNYLQNLIFPHRAEKLNWLSLNGNNFPKQNLSLFKNLVNLRELHVANDNLEKIKQGIYNHFIGSLVYLSNLKELRIISIGDTDIDSGLEFLPSSVGRFDCSVNHREDAKVRKLEQELKKHGGSFQDWKVNKQIIQVKTQVEEAITSTEGVTHEQLIGQLVEDGRLVEFNQTWQSYLNYSQSLDDLKDRRANILSTIKSLKYKQEI